MRGGVVDAREAAALTAYMRRRGLAPETIAKRLSIWRRLQAFVGDWRRAERRDIEGWLDAQHVGPATMYATISHLRGLYRWGRREGLVGANPMELVDAPRVPRRLPRPALELDVRRALAAGDLTLRAVLLLMDLGGLRCCEVARLDWADVDTAGARLWVRGKRDRDRVVAMPALLAAALDAIAPARPDGPVIGWTARAVSARVNAHLRHAGATCTAHQLRHRYATNLREHAELEVVQHALGHASVATTQIYERLDLRRVLDATAKLGI